VGRPPYGAVSYLIRWARSQWNWLDGECLLSGIHLDQLITEDHSAFLHIVEAFLWRGVLSDEGRDKLRAVLYPTYDAAPTMETWGTSRESIEAVQAAQRFWDQHDPHADA